MTSRGARFRSRSRWSGLACQTAGAGAWSAPRGPGPARPALVVAQGAATVAGPDRSPAKKVGGPRTGHRVAVTRLLLLHQHRLDWAGAGRSVHALDSSALPCPGLVRLVAPVPRPGSRGRPEVTAAGGAAPVTQPGSRHRPAMTAAGGAAPAPVAHGGDFRSQSRWVPGADWSPPVPGDCRLGRFARRPVMLVAVPPADRHPIARRRVDADGGVAGCRTIVDDYFARPRPAQGRFAVCLCPCLPRNHSPCAGTRSSPSITATARTAPPVVQVWVQRTIR